MSVGLFIQVKESINQSHHLAQNSGLQKKLSEDLSRFIELILSNEAPYMDLWNEQMRLSPFKTSFAKIEKLVISSRSNPEYKEEIDKVKKLIQSFLISIKTTEGSSDIDFVDLLQLKKLSESK